LEARRAYTTIERRFQLFGSKTFIWPRERASKTFFNRGEGHLGNLTKAYGKGEGIRKVTSERE